jgi:hypothetical protein
MFEILVPDETNPFYINRYTTPGTYPINTSDPELDYIILYFNIY